MKIIRCIGLRISMACALTISLTCIGQGSTLERMPLAKMARTAQAIVRAKCVANSAQWEAGEIWTVTDFESEETWKGSPPSRLSVWLLGGRVGSITSTVSGVPRFRVGEEAVLFLEATKFGDYSVESWMQGTFRVSRDARTGGAIVTQDTAGFPAFDPLSKHFEASGLRGVPLEAFRRQVSDALVDHRGDSR
jgi:hypothetical protein